MTRFCFIKMDVATSCACVGGASARSASSRSCGRKSERRREEEDERGRARGAGRGRTDARRRRREGTLFRRARIDEISSRRACLSRCSASAAFFRRSCCAFDRASSRARSFDASIWIFVACSCTFLRDASGERRRSDRSQRDETDVRSEARGGARGRAGARTGTSPARTRGATRPCVST